MTRSQRFGGILDYFINNVPVAQSELVFRNPFELLVSVMLSAQCTDKRVNLTTPDLFRKYPDAASLAEADEEDVFELIHSISYPRAKARHLIECARKLRDDFGGEVPSDIDSLMSLQGIGRKSANVIASIIYDKPVIAVDTHVFRVAHRTGLSDGKTPLKVEEDLERHIPEKYRAISHHWLILHGRYVCTARRPQCHCCPIMSWCRQAMRDSASSPDAPK